MSSSQPGIHSERFDRPIKGKGSSAGELQRVRELVMAFGWNATSYQIINPGMSHWFSPKGDGVIGYVQHHRFRIVAGAPVCTAERLPDVIAEFESEAAKNSLSICYFGAEARLETHLASSRRHSKLQLGAQPAWHPAQWSENFLHHASLRAQLNRARNKSVTVTEWPIERASDHPDMHRCLEEWLATRKAPTMHFLVEPRTLERLYDRRVFVAERVGRIIGFLVASPVAGRNGWLIEQIIRGSEAVNGTSELLVDTAVRAVAASGAEFITLGLSPLSKRGAVTENDDPFWIRALLVWTRAHGKRFYNFEGLDAFKAKFQPECWEPVYAIANEPRFSPATLYAIGAAFTAGSPISSAVRALWWAVRQEMANLGAGLKLR